MDVIIMFIGLITLERFPGTGTVTSYAVYLPDGRATTSMCMDSVPSHGAFIRVKDWKPSYVAKDWPWLPCTEGTSPDCRLFPLDGGEITITEITSGGSLQEVGLTPIPKLKTEHKVEKIAADAEDKSAAYLTLTNGTLSGAKFPHSSNRMLFTRLDAKISATELVVRGTGNRTISFTGNAAFDFINLPSDQAVSGPASHPGRADKSHFYLHYKLAEKDMTNEPCTTPADSAVTILARHAGAARMMDNELGPDAATIACSNSIWP